MHSEPPSQAYQNLLNGESAPSIEDSDSRIKRQQEISDSKSQATADPCFESRLFPLLPPSEFACYLFMLEKECP